MNKLRRFSIILMILNHILIMGCAVNPVTGNREFVLMSEAQEIEIGRQMDPKIIKKYGLYPDEILQEYVNQIGQKLAAICDRPDLHYQFKIVNSPIINAFALPGGYVYVTRGMLAYINSEAELAGVIGHEIGHITARHAVRQYTKLQTYQLGILATSIFYPEIGQLGQFADFLARAIIQGYGRNYELQADRLGIKYSSSAGYDPYCVSSFMKTLKNIEEATGKKGYHGLFSSHPETEDRILKAEEEAKKVALSASVNFKRSKENYLRKIDGLVFGDDPKEGVVSKNIFRHPDLRIELILPEGWEITNARDALIASHPEKKYFIQMKLKLLSKKLFAIEFAKKIEKDYRLNKLFGSSQIINGISAYVGTYQGTKREIGKIKAEVASIVIDDKGYIIMGFSLPSSFKEALPFFTSTIGSFKRISSEEAKRIKPHKIRIYTVKQGDSWESIALACGQQPAQAKKIALINGLDPESSPQPATKIKTICIDDK